MESGRLAKIEDPVDFYGEEVDYLACTLEAGQQEGAQYVLPVGIQCPVLFGIKDDLEAAGIDTEGGYKDLQELLAALLAAHESTGRDILEDTQALDWLEQYYADGADAGTLELLAQVRERCGNDKSAFAAYDALNGKKALLSGCGVMDNRKIGQNICMFSKEQQPAFLYVPAADGVKRTVIEQAAGINAQSEHAAEISRALMMYRKNLWLGYLVGMGPYADEKEYWKFNLESYILAAADLGDKRYASQAPSGLPDKTVSAYRKFISGAVQEAFYAVQPSEDPAAGTDAAAVPEKKVISVLYSDLGLGEDSGTGRWLRQAAEDFNASHEEYYVQLLRSGEVSLLFSYELMEMAEGARPDIVLFPSSEAMQFQYADMSGFLGQHSGELSFLPDGIAGGIECGGVAAGLPYAAMEYGIWCNKQTLQSAGLSEEWKPKNLTELISALRLLKEAQGIQTAAALDGSFARSLFTFMDPEHLDTYLNRNAEGEWQMSAQVWAEYMEALQQLRDEELAVPLAWRSAGITEEEAAAGTIVLDGAVQDAIADKGFYCPVRKASLEGAIEKALEEELAYGSQYVEMKELAQEYVDAYKSVLMNPGCCYYATNMYVRFSDAMKPFYEDEADYEECLKGFEDYIKVYLTE